MKRTLVFFFCFLCTELLFPQQLPFKVYSLKDGLPHSQVYSVMQDSKGFIWAATLNGAVKFDGVTFKHFTQKEGLCSNRIRSIFEDSKHNIWFCSWDLGVTKYDGKTYTTYDKSNGLVYNRGTNILEDRLGNIWITTMKGISIIDNKGKIISYEDEKGKNDLSSLSGGVVAKNGLVWMASARLGLISRDPVTHQQKIYTTADGLGNNNIYSVFEDKSGMLWAGHYGGFSRFDGKQFKQYKIPGDDNLNRVTSITEDNEGNLWMSLEGNGIVVWDKKTDLRVVNSGNGMPSDFIHKLLVDKEGNKWLASDGGGLIMFRNFAFSNYTTKEGLPVNDVQSIQKDNKGELWFALLKGGISNFSGGKFINYTEKEGLISEIAYHICIGEKDDKWISTNGGLSYYDGRSFSDISVNTGLATNLSYFSLYDKESKSTYIGSEIGLTVLKNKEYKRYYIPPGFPKGSSVRTLVKDKKGIVWIGTLEGLMYFDGDSIRGVEELKPPDHLTYLCSAIDADGTIWLGGSTELVAITYKNDKPVFRIFDSRDRFGIYGINALLVNGKSLWIGADNKICKLDPQLLLEKDSVKMRIITADEDQLNTEINSNAIAADSSGNIWFGTFKGAFKYNVTEDKPNLREPQTYITEMRLFLEPFDYKEFSDSLDPSSGLPLNLLLPYDKNHLTFDYVGLCYTAPGKVKYKYRLKGFEEKWNNEIAGRRVTYSFLEPGTYTFQLMAMNNEGVWNSAPVEFTFSILTPFWKTWWFYLLVGIFVFGLLFAAFYFRLDKLRKEKYRQQNFTKQLIQSQESERKRIAKELHDSVGQNLLIVKNKLLLDDKNNDNSKKNILETASFVDKTIEEVRDISRNLHPYQLEKLGLTRAVKSLFERAAAATGIYFTDEISIGDQHYSPDQQINLYRIAQESLNNILKHSEATAVKISMEEIGGWMQMEIRDNGKGFDMDAVQLEKSLGLVSMEERAKILNGTFAIETYPSKGTKYIIMIPIAKQ